MGWRDRIARVPGARRVVRALRAGLRREAPEPSGGYDDSPSPELELELRDLARRNRGSKEPVVGDAPCVVTMTTHGHRIEHVWTALESIARGTVRPAQMILWLDEPERDRKRPTRLRRLERRGLEVRFARPGLKVHAKYYPYVSSAADAHELPLVTCDDDMVYPRDWLEQLMRAHAKTPGDIVAQRVHSIPFVDGRIAPYVTWTPCRSTRASFAHFATSVSGQLLPPVLLDALRDAGDAFLDIAPDADDVWLHAHAVRAGVRTKQVATTSANYPFVPGTQSSGLYLTNVLAGGNDAQIARAYRAEDVARMRADAEP